MLTYKLINEDNEVQVILQGDLDIEGTELMNDELLPILVKYRVVTINMIDVPFVDSSGMGLLIKMVNTLKEQDIKITIFNVIPEVFEVFELLQIPEILGKEVFNQL